MVTRLEDRVERDQCVRNGNGLVHFKDIANQDELYNHARLFSHLVIEPGRSIGEHTHEHETEFFYILKGEGLFHDNGKDVTVYPGDVCATGYGASHSLENVSDKPLELVALIMLE